jgi:hypothetical protein
MKTKSENCVRPLLIRICLGLAPLAFASAALADEDIRVNVVVDLTAAGKKVAKPTPDHPAYYVPVAQGDKNLGDIIVHYQDRPPPSTSEVQHLLVQSLAAQGYLPATRQTPPSLILIYSWGYIAPHLMPVGKGMPIIVNEEEVVPMVAGNNTDVQLMAHPPVWMDEVLHAERQPRYYLMVSAFDFQAWRTHHVVPLWQARVSVPLWGHYLYEVMPTLVAAGVPAFGQPTGRPQQFTTDVIPAGRVVVGAPYVKNYPNSPSASPPPTNHAPNP